MAKPPAYAAGGQAFDGQGPFPGTAEVAGQRAGETQLGVDGHDEGGPAVGGDVVAQGGTGPAELLFPVAEGVLKIESAEETGPDGVHQIGVGAGV